MTLKSQKRFHGAIKAYLEKVKDFMELLRRNHIISLVIQERLLNHIKDTDSSSDVLSALNNNYLGFS
jgi:hypothetical protein